MYLGHSLRAKKVIKWDQKSSTFLSSLKEKEQTKGKKLIHIFVEVMKGFRNTLCFCFYLSTTVEDRELVRKFVFFFKIVTIEKNHEDQENVSNKIHLKSIFTFAMDASD